MAIEDNGDPFNPASAAYHPERICPKCEGSELLCPAEYETATGYFDECGPGVDPDHCAGCGGDRSEHTPCPCTRGVVCEPTLVEGDGCDYHLSDEYHQGFLDAHPFNQDCDVCFGTGWEHDEVEGSRPCLDCQPILVETAMNEADMTDAEIDAILERFDQTEPKLQRRIIARFVCENIKLKKFKEYVHARLDAAGVPADPESPHRAEGCRIGGRLDIVLAGRSLG